MPDFPTITPVASTASDPSRSVPWLAARSVGSTR